MHDLQTIRRLSDEAVSSQQSKQLTELRQTITGHQRHIAELQIAKRVLEHLVSSMQVKLYA